MMTLSRTLMSLKIVVSWKVRTTPLRATMCGARSEMRSPLKRTSPDVGRRKEAISLNSVDLPAPFGPITDRISPFAHREGDVVDGDEAAEALGEVRYLKQLGHGSALASWQWSARLSRPLGRTSISTISSDE